jgi:hypothetical protein
MRETRITLPELGLVAGTRAALGAGVALLLADRLTAEQRRAVGWTLVFVGVITTVPLALEIFGRSSRPVRSHLREPSREMPEHLGGFDDPETAEELTLSMNF